MSCVCLQKCIYLTCMIPFLIDIDTEASGWRLLGIFSPFSWVHLSYLYPYRSVFDKFDFHKPQATPSFCFYGMHLVYLHHIQIVGFALFFSWTYIVYTTYLASKIIIILYIFKVTLFWHLTFFWKIVRHFLHSQLFMSSFSKHMRPVWRRSRLKVEVYMKTVLKGL